MSSQSRTARTTAPVRALVADFPGWGVVQASGYDRKYFVDQPAGMSCRIVGTESHGAAPYTRLALVFADGSRAYSVDPAKVV